MPSYKSYLSNKNIFLFGLFLIVVGMPLSKFLMSVGQFVLLGNWIIEGDFKRKWQVMKTSKVLWVMSSFYFLHLIGLLWTSDFTYAANDLKIKLPLLWLPLLFITSKQAVTRKEMQGLLWFFTASTFIASVVCTLVWLGYTKHKVIDIRDISIFNSHIRFALMIDLVICFLLYDFFKTGKFSLYIIKLSIVVWLTVFLTIMQSATGIISLIFLVSYLVFLSITSSQNIKLKLVVIISFCIIGVVSIVYLFQLVNAQLTPIKPTENLRFTAQGNSYFTDTTNRETENGNLIWTNVCFDELKEGWNKRSKLSIDSNDKKGNPLYFTLIRYMSSKELKKDKKGIDQLTNNDIVLVENGTTNYLYTHRSGIENKIYESFHEINSYKNGNNPTGHSILMRLEFWRIGWQIIKRKPIFGVGTGDLQRAYNNQYKISGTKLNVEWWKRSHNQFMAVTIGFGIIGLIVFLLYLFYPLLVIKNKHYLFSSFFLIALLSMLNEDTLETQAGVTFFGFFHSLLLFLKDNEANNS